LTSERRKEAKAKLDARRPQFRAQYAKNKKKINAKGRAAYASLEILSISWRLFKGNFSCPLHKDAQAFSGRPHAS
jgi:hypothetical protein